MSKDDLHSTRKVGSSEMERLKELLAKVERIPEVVIPITTDLFVRVDGVLSLCELPDGSDEEQFQAAVRQIFEAGLREYEARVAMG